jgi:SAM-dependent MidA family methyltransferase
VATICFARFMELALYCPDCGFYEKENDTIGVAAIFTRASVSALIWRTARLSVCLVVGRTRNGNADGERPKCRLSKPVRTMGRLASDILNWFAAAEGRAVRADRILHRRASTRRQERQGETLAGFAPRVRWIADAGSPGDDSRGAVSNPQFNGVIFSNELLDAMPVHRLGWDARRREWFEWGVTVDLGSFVWTRMPKTSHASHVTPHVPPELLHVLPDGFTTEICPAAETGGAKPPAG